MDESPTTIPAVLCPTCHIRVEPKIRVRLRGIEIVVKCDKCGTVLGSRKIGWLEWFKLTVKNIKLLPYWKTWVIVLACSFVLFSWWDELLIWTLGVMWNWIIIPIYYVIEYGVFLPLILFLGYKTYRKLNLPYSIKKQLLESLKQSIPVKIYRKLKRREKHGDT